MGLTERQAWEYTPREFQAFHRVWEETRKRWAMEQAMFANAHFRGKDDPAWEPEHFLGTKTREAPRTMTLKEKLEVQRANMGLARITAGDPTEDIPAWAIGPKEELRANG